MTYGHLTNVLMLAGKCCQLPALSKMSMRNFLPLGGNTFSPGKIFKKCLRWQETPKISWIRVWLHRILMSKPLIYEQGGPPTCDKPRSVCSCLQQPYHWSSSSSWKHPFRWPEGLVIEKTTTVQEATIFLRFSYIVSSCVAWFCFMFSSGCWMELGA